MPTSSAGHPLAALGPKIAAGVLAVAGLSVLLLYAIQRNESAGSPASQVRVDPLATRRDPDHAVAPGVQPGAPAMPVDPPLLESNRMPQNSSTADDAAALAGLQSTIQQNPQDSAALFAVGRTLLRMSRGLEAIGPLRLAMEQDANRWDRAFAYGYACGRAEQWHDAVDAFRHARALDPTDAATSFDLALSLHKTGAFDAAVQEYEAAAQLAPRAAEPRLGRAIVLDRRGSVAEAVSGYEQALRLLADGPNADRVRGRIGQLLGQPPKGGH